MTVRPEPVYRHGQRERMALLMVNLGTPDAPTAAALRRYLAEFLWDPRVVEIPRPLWWLLLHGVILRTRPRRSAAKYRSIWTDEGSPLALWNRRQAQALQAALAARGHDLIVRPAMRYGRPAIAQVLDELRRDGVTHVLVLPMYPQYAAATTASVNDEVMRWALQSRRQPELRFIASHHDNPGYIAALARSVREHWDAHGRPDKLVLSFHGVPHRSLELGDPYHCHCHKTARLLTDSLGLREEDYLVTFQSRVGRARWLEPYTEPTLRELARQGTKRVDLICPGFVADCLETLEEIDQEARQAFLEEGGQAFHYIPCLNDRPDWIGALTDLAERHLQGWPTRATPDEQALAAQRLLAQALGATD